MSKTEYVYTTGELGTPTKTYAYAYANGWKDQLTSFDGQSIVYDAWGNCTITLDKKSYGTNNPFRYRGYYYDNDLGMYYLMTRYYDPKTGRFINADSIEYLEPNAINGLNLYAYCKNNPIMHSDPYGTDISYDCWVDEGYDPEDDLFENGGGGGGGNSTKSATNKYTNAGSNNNNGTAGNFGPNASAKNIANSMGYTKVNGQYSHGQSVYYNSKTTRSMQYISQDATSHSGGYWKAAGSVNDLFSKTTRTGTFNWNLTVRIGG